MVERRSVTGQPRVAILRSRAACCAAWLRNLSCWTRRSTSASCYRSGVGVSDYFDALLDPAAPPDTAEIGYCTRYCARAKADGRSCDVLHSGGACRPVHALHWVQLRLPTGWQRTAYGARHLARCLTLPAARSRPGSWRNRAPIPPPGRPRAVGGRRTVAEDAVSGVVKVLDAACIGTVGAALGQPGWRVGRPFRGCVSRCGSHSPVLPPSRCAANAGACGSPAETIAADLLHAHVQPAPALLLPKRVRSASMASGQSRDRCCLAR